ncbi:hypothetical protein DC31_00400 [Microbacterium sp. CH12i]|uniref:hypothetical protein n=1 Tax=Microbacterium sp. CH12i TaxID=1479651 RepID=UPI000461E2B7|nr:hypothetical protein [Microbacterium sp. CH12i]KDA07203.1 hypothetical protein DC31_00400 [Microbacterium sp. CH12i]
MPAYKVTWTQTVIATATIDVELDELAHWAIRAGIVRAGGKKSPLAPDPRALQQSLERNPHLRDALLRLYSTSTPSPDTK